jgi:hypothetical protein
MRRYIPILLIIFVTCAFAITTKAQIYVEDDFEDPAKSEGLWEFITGEWNVADGVFHQTAQGDAWLVAMVSSDVWKDEWTEYTIEVDGAQLEAGDHPLNILFRVQEPVPQVWADRNGPQTHMYRWIVNGWTNTLSRPYIYNAGVSEMLAEKPVVLNIGEFYHLKLIVTEKGFQGFIDDEEFFKVDHAEWTNGRVGLHAFSGLADFDNFMVYGPSGMSVRPQHSLAHTWGSLKRSKSCFDQTGGIWEP